jgi:hypothetical protein
MRKFVASVALATVVAVGGLLGALPAKASTYDTHFVSSSFDVVADITIDGSNNITSITGTVTGPGLLPITPISGLEPLGNSSWNYDNLFSPLGNPYVSNGGFLFDAGAWAYNIYSVFSGEAYIYYLSTFNPDGTLYNPGDPGIFASVVAETPLPAALPLFASGLGAMGLFGWRRKRKIAAALAAA